MLMEAASPERLGNHRNAPAPLQAQAEPRVPRLPRFLPPAPPAGGRSAASHLDGFGLESQAV